MPQELELELEIGDSLDSLDSFENETETETEIEMETITESSTMATSSTSSSTTSTTTSTTAPAWRPTRTTTTARPFQPLRPNRPLASMIHSTLQTIESIVYTSGVLATTLLETLMPSDARPINPNKKSNMSNEMTANSEPPEYSTLDYRENEIH